MVEIIDRYTVDGGYTVEKWYVRGDVKRIYNKRKNNEELSTSFGKITVVTSEKYRDGNNQKVYRRLLDVPLSVSSIVRTLLRSDRTKVKQEYWLDQNDKDSLITEVKSSSKLSAFFKFEEEYLFKQEDENLVLVVRKYKLLNRIPSIADPKGIEAKYHNQQYEAIEAEFN